MVAGSRRRGRFRASLFLGALALSIGIHVASVPSVLSSLLLEKPKPQLEVSYVPELTSESPPPDEEPEKKRAAKQKRVRVDQPPKAQEPPKVAEVTPPKEKPPEKPPVPPPPTPPPPQPEHKQMVDQNRFTEEADNPDAKYLAQKNHRTKEETRSKRTNLVRETSGDSPPSSEPSENKSEDVGKKDAKIAELEERKGPDKTMPRSSPMHGEEGQRVQEKKNALRMRDLAPEQGRQASSGMRLPEDKSGTAPLVRAGEKGPRAPGGGAQKGGKANLTLDHHMYDAIEGYATAEKERREAARAEASHPQGRYQRYLGKLQAMHSAIENFTPDVKPGNQSELGTRASPFAAYLTAVHRQIHKLWAFGFLSDIESKSGKTPYDDMSLVTQLSIVIKADGTIAKVGLLRSSGVMTFDAAAIDSVWSAGPFPKPPAVIKSRNGNVYVDWKFHRDERACWTVGADPHILTTPPPPGSEDGAEKGAAPLEAGPRHLSREHESEPSTTEVREAAPPGSDAQEAKGAAEGWFAAYGRGDAAWLAGWSATPFSAGGQVVARDAVKLKAMYRQLVAEAGVGHKTNDVQVVTPAGIRRRLGGLPPGGEDEGMLFAIAKVGSDDFILLLKKSALGWRVCGLDR